MVVDVVAYQELEVSDIANAVLGDREQAAIPIDDHAQTVVDGH